MFEFLDHYCASTSTTLSGLDIRADIARAVESGAPREHVNRRFYSHLAGHRWTDLLESGQQWYTAASRREGFFCRGAIDQLDHDRSRGNTIVLVSGSFLPALRPIAAALDVDAVLCTELYLREGIVTGRVHAPMIGAEKRVAVVRYAGQHHISLEKSSAYGDHESDFPMLNAVGNPVVVNADQRMRQLAKELHFAVLGDATTGEPQVLH